MKTVFVVVLATMFLFSGALNILKQLRITKALDEIVRFINLVKTEVHYTTADFENIFLNVWKVLGHGVAVIPVNRVNVFVKSTCFFVFKPGVYVFTIVHILASLVK